MATHDHARLPPSPPPSPPRRRHHRKKHSDPLQDWDTPLPSPSSSVFFEEEEQQDSRLVRAILTPLYFVSFLLSLSIVNREDRLRRSASRPTPSILSYLSLGAWPDPEPYQDPADSTWERGASTTHAEPHSALNPELEKRKQKKGEKRGWFLRKKIRKIAKLEINDAFEMRGRVIVLMLSIWAMLIAGILMGMKWLLQSLWWGSK